MIPHGREDCPLVENQLCAFSRLPIHLASPICSRFSPSVGLIGFRHALWRPVNHSGLVEAMPPGIGGGVDILVAVSVRSSSPSSSSFLLVGVDSRWLALTCAPERFVADQPNDRTPATSRRSPLTAEYYGLQIASHKTHTRSALMTQQTLSQ